MAGGDNNNEKECVDQKPGSIRVLYPRSLNITWGFDNKYSRWECSKQTSGENNEEAKLSRVRWLRVTGKCEISDLSPGVEYEVVLKVKLVTETPSSPLPVSLLLLLPDGTFRKSRMDLKEKPSGQWMELNMGSFLAEKGEPGEPRELEFDLYGIEGHWNVELKIKEAIIRPKGS